MSSITFPSPAKTLRQPKALYLLFFAQMWECFSFYGMRALLVLFMTKSLLYDDPRAFGVYAVYTALVEAGGTIGGYLADKVLGARQAIFLGAFAIILGHTSMSLPFGTSTFYLGLGFLIIGTSLFRTNCTALLGKFYGDEDPRRNAGFTLYYVGINVGGFLASIACGYVGETFGWHYGFSLASFGMIIGTLSLYIFNSVLENKGLTPKNISPLKTKATEIIVLAATPFAALMVFYYNHFIHLLPFILLACVLYGAKQAAQCTPEERKHLWALGILILLLSLFFAFEEQMGSTLVLFAERHVDRELLGFTIPASSLITINPFMIIIIGPLLSRFVQYYEQKRRRPIGAALKIGFAFIALSLAFLWIHYGCCQADHEQTVSLVYIVFGFSTIAFSELFVGPTVYSFCSAMAPEKLRGLAMGVVMLGFALANLLSGQLSQLMSVPKEDGKIDTAIALAIYEKGFWLITIACAVIGITVLFLRPLMKRLSDEI
jgi:POT family proton-dependent oligopeptide transporter